MLLTSLLNLCWKYLHFKGGILGIKCVPKKNPLTTTLFHLCEPQVHLYDLQLWVNLARLMRLKASK